MFQRFIHVVTVEEVMDKSTLDGLCSAYAVAPSPPLAMVIVKGLIEVGEPQRIDDYVDGLAKPVSQEDACIIAKALIASGQAKTALRFLVLDDPEQGLWAARAHHALDDNDRAIEIYDAVRSTSPDLRDQELDRLSGHTERPRLRVIEREDDVVTNLERYREDVTDFSAVVGLDSIKKQIHRKIILPFQKPSLFARFKKKVGGGVLLYGPPGCGKTLLARATAGECRASFFNIEISDVLDMYIGESERNLHAIFEKARTETPSVIFFDELEALAGKREFSRSSANSNVVSQFLTELDGFSQDNHGVLVLASTNVPWAIDPAFLRPGRFDRMFFVSPPDREARQGILEHHMRDRPSAGAIDFLAIARKTGGFSGADLANLVEMAADEAIEESLDSGDEVPIDADHFAEGLRQTRATTIEWLTTARNYARYANDGGRYNDVLDFIKKHGK